MSDFEGRLDALFERAYALPAEQREAFVDAACGQDQELATELRRLLRLAPLVPASFLPDSPPNQATTADSSSSADRNIPTEMGPYRLVREIGRGGMGVVYEAEQANPRRSVALKVIRTGLLTDTLASRFRQEAHVLAHLRHPGIAQVYEAGAADVGGLELPYFAMELIDGAPLDQVAEQLSVPERVELIARVCDAVQHAHQRGVIHRDLKPANILVVQDAHVSSGGTSGSTDLIGQPKIMDFGIARLTDVDVQNTSTQTEAGQIIGTFGYMSPEQVAGDPTNIDTRCDVYALGVILYLVLSGHEPHQLHGKPLGEAARIVREVEPPRLSTHDSVLRGDLDTIVTRAMEKLPERRYHSAAAMAEDLRRHLAAEPILAHPPSRMYQLRKFAVRNRTLVGGVVATIVALTAGLASSLHFLADANQQRDAAETQKQLAEAKRDDLQAMQRWYAELLSQIDVEKMGTALVGDLRTRVQTGLVNESAPDIELQLEQLDQLVAYANATDVAVDALDLALFDRAETSIALDFADRPDLQARLLATVAVAYNRLSRGARALETLDLAATALAQLPAPDPRLMADILRSRADAHEAMHDASKAVVARRATLEHCTASFGPTDPDSIQAAGKLAAALMSADQMAEARVVLETALSYDTDDPLVQLTLRTSLMGVLSVSGHDEEALSLARQVAQDRTRLQGPDHPATLAARSDFGMMLTNQGQSNEALEVFQDVVQRSTRVLGDDHRATDTRRWRLAYELRRQGRYDEAVEILTRVVAFRQVAYGADHPQFMDALRTIAMVEYRRKNFAEAERRYRQCVPVYRSALGPDHRTTTATESELGRTLMQVAKYSEAEQIFREVRGRSVAKNGEDHPLSIMFAELIASALAAQGQRQAALDLQATEIKRAERSFGRDNLRYLTLIREHVRLLQVVGRHAEAEPFCRIFLSAVQARKNELAEIETSIELGAILVALDKREEAIDVLQHAIELLGDADGPLIARPRLLLGLVRVRNGEQQRGEQEMLAAFRVLDENQDGIGVLRRAFLLREGASYVAEMYRSTGRPDQAQTWETRAAAWESQ